MSQTTIEVEDMDEYLHPMINPSSAVKLEQKKSWRFENELIEA